MNQVINSCVTALNNIGRGFCSYSAGVFIQSSVLIVLLLLIDFLLRKRIRAVFRYCLWMLVFVKLILPPTFSLPTGIGYWYGGYFSTDSPILQEVSNVVRLEHARAPAPEDFALADEISQGQPSQTKPETATLTTSDVSGLETPTWQAVVFGLWFVGVLVISVLLIQRMSFVKGLIAQSEPSYEGLEEMISQCQRQVGVRRNIELKLSKNISGPAVCGLFKPVILIPTALVEELSPDRLRAVLIHELVHIKRADIWVNLVQTVLQIIYFYNPFVWFASMVVRRIREQAVDETVLVALGAGAKSYSNTLIDIAEMAFWKTSLSLRLIGVVESKKALHRRIRHMLNRPIPKSAKVGAVGAIVIIIIAAVLLPMAKAEKKGLEVAETGQVHRQFAVTLSDGVIVELVGLGKKPWEAEQQWWRPDGVEIEKPEYKRSRAPFKWPTNPNGLQFQCAALFKFSNHQGKNVSVPEVRFSKKFLQAGLTSGIATDETQITYIVRPPNKGVFAQQIYQKTDILLAIGSVPFKKVKTPSKKFNEKMHETYFLEDNSEVIRHPLRVDHYLGTLTVDLTCPEGDFEFRVLAELKNGQTEQWHGGSVGKKVRFFHATPRRKNIKVEDIEQLIIEYRPYDWVTFRNVSLQPGVQTDVQDGIKSNRTIQAIPLKAFQFKLFEKLLDLVKQVERQYPEQATHWPAGAGLYHVDAQGQVTVWHYRALWRRSTDCAPDEVGWGSSELVNATGMYYLPDGTPLQSRWSERGNGMKDIRVKIGRIVGKDEHVPVIHRHRLPSDHDLLSRDGSKRKIEITFWKKLPVAVVVRIDKPVRLGSWWLGVKPRLEHRENYDELVVTAPPGEHQPMYVYFLCPDDEVHVLDDSGKTSLQPRFGTDVEIEPEKPAGQVQGEGSAGKQLSREQQERLERLRANQQSLSYKNMQKLGLAVAVFANDHKGRCPSNLLDLRKYIADEQIFDWINQNVVYLGKNREYRAPSDAVLAYDKSMLKKPRQETNVLYNDAHVALESSKWLKEIGIRLER